MVRWTFWDFLRLYLPCFLIGLVLEFWLVPFVLGHTAADLPFRIFSAWIASFYGFIPSVLVEDRRRRRALAVVRDVMES